MIKSKIWFLGANYSFHKEKAKPFEPPTAVVSLKTSFTEYGFYFMCLLNAFPQKQLFPNVGMKHCPWLMSL